MCVCMSVCLCVATFVSTRMFYGKHFGKDIKSHNGAKPIKWNLIEGSLNQALDSLRISIALFKEEIGYF